MTGDQTPGSTLTEPNTTIAGEANDSAWFAARSDVGRTRTTNEDRSLARPPVFAVADGMGGHQAGEVASSLAIELVAELAATGQPPDTDTIVDTLVRANDVVRARARTDPALDGMGTTCTVAVIAPGVVRIAHVGDSRAYRLRAGRFEQLTDDHSLVAGMVRQGLLHADEAQSDERRNIITRAIGAEDSIQVDAIAADFHPGDRLLLCSDGLSGMVDDATIGGVLASEPSPAEVAATLVRLANEAGGHDNITVVVVDAAGPTRRISPPVGDGQVAAAPTMAGDDAAAAVGVESAEVVQAAAGPADVAEPGATGLAPTTFDTEPESTSPAPDTSLSAARSVTSVPAPASAPAESRPRRRRGRRLLIGLVFAIAVIAIGFGGGVVMTSAPAASPSPSLPAPSAIPSSTPTSSGTPAVPATPAPSPSPAGSSSPAASG